VIVVNRAVIFVNRARRARTSAVQASGRTLRAMAASIPACTSNVQPVRAACPSCTSNGTASTFDVQAWTARCTTCTRALIPCTSNGRSCTCTCVTLTDAGEASTSSRPTMSSSVTVSTLSVDSIEGPFTIITGAGQGLPGPLRPSTRRDPVGNVDVREIQADVTEIPATFTARRSKFTTFIVEPLDSARDSREIPSAQTIPSSATIVHRGAVLRSPSTGFAIARGFSPGSPTMERKALHLPRCTSHRAVRAGAANGSATSLRTCTARRSCRAPSDPALPATFRTCSSSAILLRYDARTVSAKLVHFRTRCPTYSRSSPTC